MDTPFTSTGTDVSTGTGPTPETVAALLTQLRATHDNYEALIAPYSEEALHRRPAPDEWSGVEVIAHLADLDLFNRTERYNVILNEAGSDAPHLPAYDPDARIAAANYQALTALDALQLFKTERDTVVMLFEGLRPHEWARIGIHPTRGPQTLFEMANTLAGHDQMHMGQLQAAAGA